MYKKLYQIYAIRHAFRMKT